MSLYDIIITSRVQLDIQVHTSTVGMTEGRTSSPQASQLKVHDGLLMWLRLEVWRYSGLTPGIQHTANPINGAKGIPLAIHTHHEDQVGFGFSGLEAAPFKPNIWWIQLKSHEGGENKTGGMSQQVVQFVMKKQMRSSARLQIASEAYQRLVYSSSLL